LAELTAASILDYLLVPASYRILILVLAQIGVLGASKLSHSRNTKEIILWVSVLMTGIGSVALGTLMSDGFPLSQIQAPYPLPSQVASFILVGSGAIIAVMAWLALGSFRKPRYNKYR